ncbi:hypothetical protein E6P97_01745 [Patescibacteria group bacterium]|nr:MAG: hypothetical protein E6P97_01745 [Patescibacteria group bacterium]
MSAERVSGAANGVRDNDRPVEVTYIAEATFQDILDIGVGELAVRDATVIDRITEPGYDDFIDRMAVAGRAFSRRIPRAYVTDSLWDGATDRSTNLRRPAPYSLVRSDEFFPRIEQMYRLLRQSPWRESPGANLVVSMRDEGAQNPADRPTGQQWHVDGNYSGRPRATLNFTLFNASRNPWLWRLTPSRPPIDDPAVDVPLVSGGLCYPRRKRENT